MMWIQIGNVLQIKKILETNVTVAEAGRKGGLSTLQRRGRNHFISIGREGQRAMRRKYPNAASEWGKLGGRPKKLSLSDMGEARIHK
jgi:general stress protein YciG